MESFNFESILSRLKERLGFKSDRQVALYLNVLPDTLNRWKKRNSIPIEILVEFAQKEGLTLDWLLLGRGVPSKEDSERTVFLKKFNISQEEFDDFFIKIPLLTEKIKSDEMELSTNGFIFFPVHFLSVVLNSIYEPKNLVSIYITSDAMEPTMLRGSIMIVDRNETEIEDGRVFVFLHDGVLYIRRTFFDITKNVVLLKCDNPVYPQLEFTMDRLEELRVVGKLVGYIGKMV